MSSYDHGGDIFGTARRLGVDPGRMIDFSASINPLGMPEGVRRAIVEGVDRVLHYPDPFAGPLRGLVASCHNVSPEEIVLANGSTELIYLLPRLFRGNRALIVAPAFSEYAKALSVAGWEVRHHLLSPDDGFGLEVASLAASLAKGCDLLFICNPGNPTGRLYGRDELLAVADACRDIGTVLVLDEAFIDFCGESASLLPDLVRGGGSMVLRSLTKFYAIPGLRLGYAAASADICRRLSELGGPWSVNALAQAAGAAALTDAGYRQRTVEYIEQERELLYRQLSAIPGLVPFEGAANYLLVRTEVPASRLCEDLLLRSGLIVRDCSSFTGLDRHFFRVAVRSREENRALVESLRAHLEGE